MAHNTCKGVGIGIAIVIVVVVGVGIGNALPFRKREKLFSLRKCKASIPSPPEQHAQKPKALDWNGRLRQLMADRNERVFQRRNGSAVLSWLLVCSINKSSSSSSSERNECESERAMAKLGPSDV